MIFYINESLKYDIIKQVTIEKMLWLLCIKVGDIVMILVYRSPSSSIADVLLERCWKMYHG